MPRARIAAIEGLRVAAVAGVVLIHVTAWSLAWPHTAWSVALASVARAAVPAFMLVSGYFWAQRARDLEDVKRSAWQLLVPYAIWSAVYLAVEVPSGLRAAATPARIALLFITGTSAWHLWFLPALFGCRVLGVFARGPRTQAALAVLGGGVLAFAATSHVPAVLDTLVHASTLPWMGVFFLGSLLTRMPERGLPRAGVGAAVLGCLALMAANALVPAAGALGDVVFTASRIALPAVLLLDARSGGDALRLAWLAPAAPLAFGVYLVHMLPVDGLRLTGPLAVPVGPLQLALAWLFALAVSAALAALLRGFAVGRIALGERSAPAARGATETRA